MPGFTACPESIISQLGKEQEKQEKEDEEGADGVEEKMDSYVDPKNTGSQRDSGLSSSTLYHKRLLNLMKGRKIEIRMA